MSVIRHIKIIKYWLKIISGKKTNYVCSVYNHSVQSADFDKVSSWANSVKQLLCSTGFGEVWYNQGVGNENAFISVFKCQMFDIFKQNWKARLNEMSKSRFYKISKPHFTTSNYLDIVGVKCHRIALARLVMSSHPFITCRVRVMVPASNTI